MKKIILLYLTAVIMAFAVFAASFVYYKNTIPEPDTEPAAKLGSEGGYLNISPVGLLCERSQKCAYNNGLLYLSSEQGIYECDTQNGVMTMLLQRGENEHYECINVYNGYIYAVCRQYIYGRTIYEGTVHFHMIRIDYNTREMTTLYSADEGREIADMAISSDGVIYFTERDSTDTAGLLPQNSVLYSFTDGGVPTLITQADRYYIDKDRLYITRYEIISDTERLYFAPREKPDDLTETFLAVGRNISMGGGVMFMPLGGGIYYTDESYDLCRYDLSTQKSEHITGFDEEKNIYYYTVFDGRMLILVREQNTDGSWCYVLYYLDETNTPVRITGDDELNEGQKYRFEYIDGICTFAGNDEFFAVITYDQNIDSRVYTVDKQLQINMAMQSGEWDYLSFEKMKDGIRG